MGKALGLMLRLEAISAQLVSAYSHQSELFAFSRVLPAMFRFLCCLLIALAFLPFSDAQSQSKLPPGDPLPTSAVNAFPARESGQTANAADCVAHHADSKAFVFCQSLQFCSACPLCHGLNPAAFTVEAAIQLGSALFLNQPTHDAQRFSSAEHTAKFKPPIL